MVSGVVQATGGSKELEEREKQVRWRKRSYSSGVLLLLTGFVVQTIGILFP